MRSRIAIAMGWILLGSALPLCAQGVAPDGPITLGTPEPLTATESAPAFRPLSAVAPSVVRARAPPPPPAFPGGGPPPVAIGPGGAAPYNQGVVNSDADLGSFWSRLGNKFSRCWDDITGNASGAFQSTPKRQMFQSDHDFDVFSSPMTNPYFFVDPRALTEIRPVFIWQHTPSNNPVWNGGNNFDYTLVGSVAVTENISFVVNRLGFTTIAPHGGTTGISSNTGFSETMLGPKLTFLRSETSGTVAAVGLTFIIPDGSSAVLQDTGHLMLDPYFSIAQNFGKSEYGSFNFMNTTGYNFRTDNTRSEALYSSFHLDYEIAKPRLALHRTQLVALHPQRRSTQPRLRRRRSGQLRLAIRVRPRRVNRGNRHARQAQQFHLLGRRRRIQHPQQQRRPTPRRLPPDHRFDLPLLKGQAPG